MNRRIEMRNYRAEGSKLYSGRPLGIDVRRELNLNEKDNDGNTYDFVFPKDTISINSSYFGGLFEKSVMELGKDGFLRKYKFQYPDGSELKETLKQNINEGIADALLDF